MRNTFWLLILFLPYLSFSQAYQQPDAAQIKLKLKKLNFLGSVLYVAAHPDDENTDVIAYLSNSKLAATAYLSMTRGDGGQNLIGPEIRDLLGLIRTQELLAARRIDGGQQFFTRANDFGFSKSVKEAFAIWGKDEVLSDVVRVYRQYQPDVIITRFPPDDRAGHGHHTASAVLAGEAFDAAVKADVYPDQVKQFGTWKVKRLFTNTGRWWNKTINENTPGIITLEVGGYNTLLGKSYSEISALSSSQHKSQGWGRRGERGYQPEFLEPMKGEPAQKDIFEGVNTTWSRVKGGEKIQPLVDQVIREFKVDDPSLSTTLLFQIQKEISKLEDSVWKVRKLKEVNQLIQDCLGLFIEVTSPVYNVSPSLKFKPSIEIINRAEANITLEKIESPEMKWDTITNAALKNNIPLLLKATTTVSPQAEYSDPYWLKEPHNQGLFTVKDQTKIGLPQNPPAINFSFFIKIGEEKITIQRPLIYKWVDPVKGELWRPLEIVPPVFINLSEKVIIFNNDQPKIVSVRVQSAQDSIKGNLTLTLPAGWRSEPTNIPFEFTTKGQELTQSFQVYPSQEELKGAIYAIAEVNGKKYDHALQLINYDHFPIQTLLPKAQANVIRFDLKKAGNVIAYIKGAGDEIPAALRNMGYEVWEMKNEEVTLQNLKKADAVVLGVRALNTNERTRFFMNDLLEYTKEGGTLIVQYNTNSDLQVQTFSPFPITLSRDRVTQEDAEVKILKPEHTILNSPNKITSKDFEGWVQERGLYYPNKWDNTYEAIFSMNDAGETPKDGSLLVAPYGKGYYVYTGLSFFRELPEGVAGAYKLFANIVSLGKEYKPANQKIKTKTK
jgi:LmbE family N-acetylglucosaminyl deacetylase